MTTIIESCHSGIRARRFRTPEFKDAVPDMLLMSDGSFKINPEWEKAQYEEVFFDKDKKELKARTLYGAVRELNQN